MSRKSLGVMITCDICRKAQIAEYSDVQIRTDWCAISGSERGVEVSMEGYGFHGDTDICLDCRIESLEKALDHYRRYK